jgi:hypothetical protein
MPGIEVFDRCKLWAGKGYLGQATVVIVRVQPSVLGQRTVNMIESFSATQV